jgi:FkbM family methyltransferase
MTFPEERAAISAVLSHFGENPVLVELGAHEGEDTEWMLAALAEKRPRAILVEADFDNYQKLLLRFMSADAAQYAMQFQYPRIRHGNLTLAHNAIADHNGRCDFWGSAESGGGFGSIYEPIPGAGLSVQSQQFKQGTVACSTFDWIFCGEGLRYIDLLWVDIHGAEKDMIAHGQLALARTSYMMIEVFDAPLYKGMATKSELLAMLPGWSVVASFPWNLLLRNENRE